MEEKILRGIRGMWMGQGKEARSEFSDWDDDGAAHLCEIGMVRLDHAVPGVCAMLVAWGDGLPWPTERGVSLMVSNRFDEFLLPTDWTRYDTMVDGDTQVRPSLD